MKQEERGEAMARSWRTAEPLLVLASLCNLCISGCSVRPSAEEASLDQEVGEQLIQQAETLYTHFGSFRVHLTETDSLLIMRDQDTVYRWSEATNIFRVRDFDGDGNEDVVIGQNSDYMGDHLIIFHPEGKRFAEVKGFTKFPNPVPVPGTAYFHSYHRSGCADLNWTSDLFEIIADSTVWHGHLFGHGCEYGPIPSIKMFRVDPSLPKDQWHRIDSLPMDSAWTTAGGKWDFIARYWANNFDRFILRTR